MRKLEYKNYIVFGVLLVASGLIVPLHFAHAVSILDFGFGALLNIVNGLVNIISWIFGITLVPLSASIVNWIFNNTTLAGGFTQVPVVTAGWAIARDLANMFFILILLVIGFATVIRYESYGIKRLLPRLIIVALVVNFSLLVGGVFIDIGNDLTTFFITGGSGSATQVGDSIIIASNMNRGIIEANITSGANANAQLLINNVMRVVFTAILAFLLLAIGLVMIFRLVYLWILLILAPLAWVAYIWPGTARYGQNWWSQFLRWAFFPAIFGFFVYLALLVGTNFGATTLYQTAQRSAVPGLSQSGTIPFGSLGFLLQYIVVIMILLFGLSAANKFAPAGASAALKIATDAKNRGLGYAKRAGKAGATFAGQSAARAIPEEKRRWAREGLERAPLVGRAMGGPGARYKEKQAMIKKYQEEFKGLRPQDLQARAKQGVSTLEGQARRAAAIAELAKKDALPDEFKTKKYLGEYLNAGGSAKDILQYMPSWAYDEGVQDLLASHFATKKDWGKVSEKPKGSPERSNAAYEVLSEKIPKKPSDFVLMHAPNIDLRDPKGKPALTPEQRSHRGKLLYTIGDLLAQGKITVKHINAAANKNPKLYEVLMRMADEKERGANPVLEDVWSRLPENTRDSILRMPGNASFMSEGAAE